MSSNNKIIIAIDGYSSCGKSTLAKALANALSYAYVDTGAMYRAVTLYFLREHIDITDFSKVNDALNAIHIHFSVNADNGISEVYLNNENVERQIRTMEVAEQVSKISAIKEVRKRMVALQQAMGAHKGLVMDGRDIGTAVFPKAELKLFMTASPEIRVQRRFDELSRKGVKVSIDEVRANVIKRDYDDTHRVESPLIQATDAVVIDNSNYTEAQQFKLALELAQQRIQK